MKRKKIIGTFLLACILGILPGCGTAQDETGAEDRIVIGVCAYDTSYVEMQMFMNYYRDYISQGMSVDFLFSESLTSGEEEQEFIRLAKEEGAEGIISFYGQDIQGTLELCEEERIYYVLGSGTISDSDFEAAKDNEWFLGVIGPDTEEEYQAGYDMASSFRQQGAKSWLILSGGASTGNYMHSSRVEGMLDALGGDADVTICPGYLSTEEGKKNLEHALAQGGYDAVMAAMSFGDGLETVCEAEKVWDHPALVGTVDCFSGENLELVQDGKLNYVAGKYASMAGPAVAAVYNAVTGHPEAVRQENEPFRLSQKLWKAGTAEQYEELYGFTQGVYENAYSCDELMQVIAVFEPETGYEDFAALTEASDVESVERRILNRE